MPHRFEVILRRRKLGMIADAIVLMIVAGDVRRAAIIIAAAMIAVACVALWSDREAGRPGCRARDGDRALRDAGYRRSASYRRGSVDVSSASDRDIVARYVGRIGNKTLSGCLDFGLIGSQGRARVSFGDAL